MIGDIQPPPAIYDHAYPGRLIEQHVDNVAEQCRRYGVAGPKNPFQYIAECAIPLINNTNDPVKGVCILVLPIEGPGGESYRTVALLRQHGIGHCNGWKHD